MLRFSPFTQKENIIIQNTWAQKKKLPCTYRAFSSLRSKKVWPKATSGIRVFGRQVIFAIKSEHKAASYGLPVLIARFIPAHLVSPTLPSLQMITVQNHLGLQNPAQSILFSPAAQGCKKYSVSTVLFSTVYI